MFLQRQPQLGYDPRPVRLPFRPCNAPPHPLIVPEGGPAPIPVGLKTGAAVAPTPAGATPGPAGLPAAPGAAAVSNDSGAAPHAYSQVVPISAGGVGDLLNGQWIQGVPNWALLLGVGALVWAMSHHGRTR